MDTKKVIKKNSIINFLIQKKMEEISNGLKVENQLKKDNDLFEIYEKLDEKLKDNFQNFLNNIINEIELLAKKISKQDSILCNQFDVNVTKREKEIYLDIIENKLYE